MRAFRYRIVKWGQLPRLPRRLGVLALVVGLLAALSAAAPPAPPAQAARPKPTTTTSTSSTTTTTTPAGGCCLNESNIIQANGGNTGGARVTAVPFSLPNPVRTDTYTVVFFAIDISSSSIPTIPTITDAGQDWIYQWATSAAFNQADSPYIHVFVAGRGDTALQNWGGGTSWTATFPTSVAASWVALEVSGLLSFNHANDSFVQHNNKDNTGSATAIDTTNGGPAEFADDLLLSAFASRVASGTPPSVTGVANTTDQPGTWVSLFASQATSNSSGANVRLDVYRKFTEGVSGTWDATASYSATSFLVALVAGMPAQPPTAIPPAAVLSS
jgi:hypothetical protein